MRLTPYKVRVYDMEYNRIEPEMLEIGWNMDAAMKNGFPHFMLKEIHEQPEALRNTILPACQGTCRTLPRMAFRMNCSLTVTRYASLHAEQPCMQGLWPRPDGTPSEDSRYGVHCIGIPV